MSLRSGAQACDWSIETTNLNVISWFKQLGMWLADYNMASELVENYRSF